MLFKSPSYLKCELLKDSLSAGWVGWFITGTLLHSFLSVERQPAATLSATKAFSSISISFLAESEQSPKDYKVV